MFKNRSQSCIAQQSAKAKQESAELVRPMSAATDASSNTGSRNFNIRGRNFSIEHPVQTMKVEGNGFTISRPRAKCRRSKWHANCRARPPKAAVNGLTASAQRTARVCCLRRARIRLVLKVSSSMLILAGVISIKQPKQRPQTSKASQKPLLLLDET